MLPDLSLIPKTSVISLHCLHSRREVVVRLNIGSGENFFSKKHIFFQKSTEAREKFPSCFLLSIIYCLFYYLLFYSLIAHKDARKDHATLSHEHRYRTAINMARLFSELFLEYSLRTHVSNTHSNTFFHVLKVSTESSRLFTLYLYGSRYVQHAMCLLSTLKSTHIDE